jgi:hypothetical protein
MSWGYKILVFYLGFVGLMGTLVYGAFQHKVNLVSTDYYERELIFQDVLDGSVHYNRSGEHVLWEVQSEEMTLTLPENLSFGGVEDLEIWLYHPYEGDRDIKINEKQTDNTVFIFPFNAGESHSMKIQVRWKHKGIPYYYESNIKA